MRDNFLMQQLQVLQRSGRRHFPDEDARALRAPGVPSLPQAPRREMSAFIEEEIARRVLCGEKFGEIAAALNRKGLRGKRGGRWYCASVRACWLATVKKWQERNEPIPYQ